MTPEEEAVEAADDIEADEGAVDMTGVRLTDRDRQLCGLLATARYLSTGQLARLLFPERSTINLKKRLLALAGEGKHGVAEPYLKRIAFRTWDGKPECAWVATPRGYAIADTVLLECPRVPSAGVGTAFLDHQLMLNELYVQVLEAPLKAQLRAARARASSERDPSKAFEKHKGPIYAKATHVDFRWVPSDMARLPWHEFTIQRRKAQRLIVPDAILALTEHHKRYFVECETGSQPVVAASEEKRGATLAKLQRYRRYLVGIGDAPRGLTHYRVQFPDGYEPSILFLVRNRARRDSINEAIRNFPQGGQVTFDVQALTIEAAAAEFLTMLGHEVVGGVVQVKPKRPVTSGEYRVLSDFYNGAVTTLKALRAEARAQGREPPAYPASAEELRQLLQAWGARKRA